MVRPWNLKHGPISAKGLEQKISLIFFFLFERASQSISVKQILCEQVAKPIYIAAP